MHVSVHISPRRRQSKTIVKFLPKFVCCHCAQEHDYFKMYIRSHWHYLTKPGIKHTTPEGLLAAVHKNMIVLTCTLGVTGIA